MRVRAAHLVLGAQLVVYWPVWRWYVARMTDLSDEPWGILALGTALVFLVWHGVPKPLTIRQMWLPMVCALIYAVSWPWLPPLPRAMLAVTAIGYTLSSYCMGRGLHLGILGLLLLSLPIIASLQFYAGYPVRWLTAYSSAPLISLTGFPVTAQGTTLFWMGETIAVDAPCSGVKMLWAGLYLTFTLACFTGLGLRATWLAYSLSVSTIFVGNVLRATLLFYLEAGIVPGADSLHAGIGMVLFSGVAGAILTMNRLIRRSRLCAGSV